MIRLLFWLGYGWRGKAFALTCGMIGFLVVLSVAIPYEPYTPHALEVRPDYACRSAEISIYTTREWRRTWWLHVQHVRVFTQWRDVKTGARFPGFTGPTVPNWDHPTGRVKSDLRVPVPETPAEYELLLAYDIEGGILLAPRHQIVPENPGDWLVSKNTVVVIPDDCE